MEVFKHKSAVTGQINYLKSEGKTIGLVPTMGALHEGHRALLDSARGENDVLVCSIFVNPTQFDDPADLQNYPVTLEDDEAMLRSAGCDILFMPGVAEMYPDGPASAPPVDPGYPATIMEGARRKGHFDGVTTIVGKLFDTITPHKAYFGQKDYQQFIIIRDMARRLNLPVKVVMVPTVREPSGLALSSRNRRLSAAGKGKALHIFKALSDVKRMYRQDSPRDAVDYAINTWFPGKEKPEYLDIRNAGNLHPVSGWHDAPQLVACMAAGIENVRLIDNVLIP